ncbi:YqjK-like family protein [Halomonas sabkhae]|uniref:YqjK-like family protein n=1 Tax=Halomonas sabkhae TaxID=626223 RepID=UPI0025B3E28A|nr:YqjK-like family protein [Halomonas sabkhae]MDN3523661.1 YqjK-like family protein [Halomonas sabkhae]
MKRHNASNSRDAPPSRRQRKAALEATIEDQRLDTLMASEQWHDATSPLDDRWEMLSRLRTPLLIGSGILLTVVLRRPGPAIKAANRVAMGALTLKRLGKLLS